jgi:DNA-directed RNA polymerase I and III subunit RPAC1
LQCYNLFNFTSRIVVYIFEHSLATASYRLLPHIEITKPIPPHLAEKFQACFSPGVIKIDPITKKVTVDEQNVRKDSVSREVLRHPEFADSVKLGRVRDFFLCMFHLKISRFSMTDWADIVKIESESAYIPERLFVEATKIMREKISVIRNAAVALRTQLEDLGDVEVTEA